MPSTSLLALGLAFVSSVSAGRSGYPRFGEKQFSQAFLDGYNLLKFTSSLGPYSDRVAYGVDRNTPAGCEVDQVFLLMRHGERYPDYSGFGSNYEAVLAKMAAVNVSSWKSDLTFLNDWTYYVDDAAMYSQESYSGAYAGLADAYARGSDYRLRYGHLWDKESIVPIFSSGYERVIETARYFGQGFFGYNYSTNAAVNIISESSTQGANSLTPSCPADPTYTSCLISSFSKTMPELGVAAARFNEQNPGLNLTALDVSHLMQMAAFELNVRAYTPWAEAFTLDEWVSYGYIWDLMYYYCVGPGSDYQTAVGQVYTNATRVLMEAGPTSGSMFWSFVHDTNITPVIAALGLDVPENHLPNDTIPFPNKYRAADIVPMGGHLTLERMTCNATVKSAAGVYVRAVINEAVVPFNTCQNGPGYSCPLANYSAIVDTAPRFDEKCNTSSTYPQYLEFFWNYNTSTQYNFQDGPIGYQLTDTSV
ncbi:acid phosphatase pho5 [Sporothrix eucalyptigena]|uniref:3-phytase n=1 Tax=Sporothrix eucalyptigena TaxID=1812306 RepID=A0ABP0CFZ2_9PEZI